MGAKGLPVVIMDTKKIFCHAPWSNLEILPTGAILPCCKFQDSHYQDSYNIRHHDLGDYLGSEMLATVRNDFEQGRWPRGCDRCRIEEQSHIASKRQLDAARWQSAYRDYQTESAELLTLSMALGNTCNLKCIMCGPAASSSWAREHQDIYGVKIESMTKYRQSVLQEILQRSDQVIHLDIHGGEPFLAAPHQHLSLLDHFIDTGRAAQISIHYTTNGTVWPSADFIHRWQRFRHVDLQISIDGIRKRFEYIRFPASWDSLCQNIDLYLALVSQHAQFDLSVAHTVSAFNILYLEEFFDWCHHTGLPDPWCGRLHNPNHLRSTVWPCAAREMIAARLNNSSRMAMRRWGHHVANTDDSDYWAQFRNFVHTHDQYRGVNFATVFPELTEYL